MKIDKEKIKQLLSRNVQEVVNYQHLEKRLLKGEKLRVKHGVDPTGPEIHLGRAITLWKLREFQKLGHKIVLILGDYTAQIGDPSDKLHKRPFLSEKQIKENLKNYKKQISQILNKGKIEWHRNSKWLGKLKLRKLDELADLFSVQQMVARRNFKTRWEKQEDISLRELHYPLYQGYDSVMIKADIEVGGNDQLFNLLAGRKIQQAYNQEPQDIITFEMLEGLDENKMSTSQGNVVNITDAPKDQYGKLMSMKDNMIIRYFKLCTQLTDKEIKDVEEQLKKGVNPRDLKARLSFEIVKLYHGENQAKNAEQEFNRVFRDKKLPENISVYKINKEKFKLIDILVETKLAVSKGEARRLIKQGGVKINDETIKDWQYEFQPSPGMIIKVGKRKFIKLIE